MKFLGINKATRRAIAMTEYLIILAIVAIAAIAIVAAFGKQIKSVFTSSGNALQGKEQADEAMDADGNKVQKMGDFQEGAAVGGGSSTPTTPR